MDISVIVPCYNSERYLRVCLEALLSQSYPTERYEVILVDNGSTDRSAAVAREYPAVRILDAPKRSSYAARNVGVRAASGRILAFTDSDCTVCPTWLEQIGEAMEDQTTAVILGGRRFGRETLVLSTLADYEMEKARYVCSQDDASLYFAYAGNMAVKREVFERQGPFMEVARGADVIFVSTVLEAYGCESVRFLPEALIRIQDIDRWFHWHQKMFIYGRSYQRYRLLCRTRPLGYAARLEILRRSARRNSYGLPRTMFMLTSGVVVTVAYELGRVVGRRSAGAAPG